MKDKLKKIIIVVVLCVMASLISYSYAIYRSNTGPNGSIQLATWDVSLDQDEEENYFSIVPGDSTSVANYTLNVTSNSEVDIIYSIIIEDVPNGVSIALDNGTFVTGVNNEVIFNEVGTIDYDDVDKTKTHTLSFKAASNTQYSIEDELNVNVVARQVLPS